MAIEHKSSFEPKPFGRYVLLEKLAIGGMAEIYKAKTYGVDGFEKLLAIKRILPHCAADSDFIRMLVDEAKLTVLLSHANIVQVYDLGKVSDDYFISMEFINGTNLRELLARLKENGEKIPEEIAVYILSEVAKGLDYAHRKTDSQGNPLHIVHRDISPQNILLSFEAEVKIVDFGIAKAAMNVSHTMAGILKGKVAYMSPEQALGKPIDHRTDIFSAGVLLYEMLTGEKLFSGESQFEILNQIRTTRVNTLMLPDTIPGPLKAILAKGLAYQAKDRYQSAGDLQLDLTKYLYSSYVDFSPRVLSKLLSDGFSREIRKKEQDPAIDDKTRSVLIKEAAREAIVVHNPSAPKLHDTAVSELIPIAPWKLHLRKISLMTAGVILAAAIGYGAYQLFSGGPEETKKEAVEKIAEPTTDFGSILVRSKPDGARIFLNQTDTGLTTPSTLSRLTVGEEYQITIKKDLYQDRSRTIPLTSTETITLDETLEPVTPVVQEQPPSPPAPAPVVATPPVIPPPPVITPLPPQQPVAKTPVVKPLPPQKPAQETPKKEAKKVPEKKAPEIPTQTPKEQEPEPVASSGPPGSLSVNSNPSGADVYVNSEFRGTTPLTIASVPSGTIKVVVAKEGKMRNTMTVHLDPGEKKSLGTIRLEDLYGEVSVSSMPGRGTVYFDGEPISARTPVTIRRVPRDKSHHLLIQLDGYKPWETTVNLKDKDSKRYDVQLEKAE